MIIMQRASCVFSELSQDKKMTDNRQMPKAMKTFDNGLVSYSGI